MGTDSHSLTFRNAIKCRPDKSKGSFKNLLIWQKAVELSLAVYKLTESFPTAERFGLTNQLRRAAVSVASNIDEGYGRSTRGEYLQFLGNSLLPLVSSRNNPGVFHHQDHGGLQ
jgi:hypothetical protein